MSSTLDDAPFFSMNLRLKLLSPFVLLLAIVFYYSTYVLIPNYSQLIKDKRIQQESTYVDLLSTAVLPDLIENDLANMYTTLDKVLNEHQHWYSLHLYNQEGLRLYPLEEKSTPDHLALDPLTREIIFDNTNYASIKLLMDISAPTDRELEFIQSIQYSILVVLLLTFIAILILLETTVRKPLSDLTSTALRIARGNYNVPVSTASQDEVGQLGHALDVMRLNLRDREAEMAYYVKIQNTIRLIQSKFVSEQNEKQIFLELQRHILQLTHSEIGFLGELVQHDWNHLPIIKSCTQEKVLYISDSRTLIFNANQNKEIFHEENTLLGEVSLHGQPIIDNAPHLTLAKLGFAVPHFLQCQNFIGLPLYSGQHFVGILCLVNSKQEPNLNLFEDLDVLLQSLAQLMVAYRERRHLVSSEARLRTVVDNSVEGIISTDEKGVITEFNAAAERIFGYSHNQVCGQQVNVLIPADLNQEYSLRIRQEFLQPQVKQVKQVNNAYEIIGLSRTGTLIPLEVSIARVASQEEVRFTGIIRDITERKRQEAALSQAYDDLQDAHKKLAEQSRQDGLTQLANRRYMEERLHSEWHQALRYDSKKHIALILCDVDFFKHYNDNYGHPQGDVCLKQVADILAKSFSRESDLVARYGGEEFIVVLPDTPADSALKLAERMLERIWKMKLEHKASPIAERVTLSAGIACAIPAANLKIADLINQADLALYHAKNMGRNQVVTYQERFAMSDINAKTP